MTRLSTAAPRDNSLWNSNGCKQASNDDKSDSTWPKPLHPLIALAMIPLMPSWLFLNRGFTQWFHWGFIFYLVTGQLDFCCRFLVLQGGAVSVGWYAAVAHDYLVHSRFCHLLYNNMPPGLKTLMLSNAHLASGGIIQDDSLAFTALVLSHVIDILAHPFLTYVMWKIHRSRGGSIRSLLSWDVIVSTYALSRVYSITHQLYNRGTVTGLFYYGYDVYKIDNLDAYTAAYAGEVVFYLGLLCYKLYLQWNIHRLRLKIRIVGRRRRSSIKLQELAKKNQQLRDRKPLLMQSSSCFSSESSPDFLENDDDDDRTC
jgi:hypothetical protein